MRVKAKLLRLATLLMSYLPSKLPETDPQHEAWARSIVELSGYPDNDSFRSALATMILHLPQGTFKASKQSFIKQIKRSVANQTAFNIMADIKLRDKQRDRQQAEEANAKVVQEASQVGV